MYTLPRAQITSFPLIPRSTCDKLIMSKDVGQRVCCVFDDDNRYHGEVTKVIYHDIHAQYMYRVVYEDSDEADYWILDT